jgi:hypothetical protein
MMDEVRMSDRVLEMEDSMNPESELDDGMAQARDVYNARDQNSNGLAELRELSHAGMGEQTRRQKGRGPPVREG